MILSREGYEIAAIILILAGLAAAVLSLLERRVKWVQRFCAFFGEGCRRTATFTILGISISWWGIAYYVVLGLVYFIPRPLLFWVVMAGFGVECTFVATMIIIRALCVFCALNSLVVVLLTILSFDVHLAWPGILLAVVTFAGSLAVISRENRAFFKKPAKGDILADIEREAEQGLNPALGPENAPVKVIEFSDYMCPHCRKAQSTVKRIRQEYRGRIRWVYMDFPLDMHQGAKELARAPRCARDQGKFWEFHELVFEAGGRPTAQDLEDMARKLGLNIERFRECRTGTKHADEIERDLAEGTAAGVSATPTFLVNGKALVAPSYNKLKGAIEQVLEAAG